MPGAVDGFHELADIFDTCILSASPWTNPSAWSDKREWVKAYLGDSAYKRLILTSRSCTVTNCLIAGNSIHDSYDPSCRAIVPAYGTATVAGVGSMKPTLLNEF